jgi:hypothetical protein
MALVVVFAVAPAGSETIRIDPSADPAVTLPPDDAARLRTLLSWGYPPLLSDVSPDDRTVLTATGPGVGQDVVFLDLRTKATVPVGPSFFDFQAVTAYRWRDRGSLVFVGFNGSGDAFLVSLSRVDGSVTAEPLALTGSPLSLSSNGGRLVVGREVTAAAAGATPPLAGPRVSPFVERKRHLFKRRGPAIFDFVSDDEAVVCVPFELSYHFYLYNLRSQKFRRLATPSGTIYQPRSKRHSRELVYNFSSFQQPYEMYRIHVDADGPKQLTNANAAVAAANRIRADRVRFRLDDGDRREGFLLQPAGASFPPRNVPLVVWQEGGPNLPMTEQWLSTSEEPFNLLPNFGFALLIVPLPGRVGFGSRFIDELVDRRNFGEIDIDEQAEISRQLVERGYTSPARLGITGFSYGGYFTSQSITRHRLLHGPYARGGPRRVQEGFAGVERGPGQGADPHLRRDRGLPALHDLPTTP